MPGCHKEKNFIKCRIKDPDKYEDDSFRTKKIGKEDIRLVLGCRKAHWDEAKEKCDEAQQVQAVRLPASHYTAKEAKAWIKNHPELKK